MNVYKDIVLSILQEIEETGSFDNEMLLEYVDEVLNLDVQDNSYLSESVVLHELTRAAEELQTAAKAIGNDTASLQVAKDELKAARKAGNAAAQARAELRVKFFTNKIEKNKKYSKKLMTVIQKPTPVNNGGIQQGLAKIDSAGAKAVEKPGMMSRAGGLGRSALNATFKSKNPWVKGASYAGATALGGGLGYAGYRKHKNSQAA